MDLVSLGGLPYSILSPLAFPCADDFTFSTQVDECQILNGCVSSHENGVDKNKFLKNVAIIVLLLIHRFMVNLTYIVAVRPLGYRDFFVPCVGIIDWLSFSILCFSLINFYLFKYI